MLNPIFQIAESQEQTNVLFDNKYILSSPDCVLLGLYNLETPWSCFNSLTKLLSKLVQAQRHQSQDVFCENVKTTRPLNICENVISFYMEFILCVQTKNQFGMESLMFHCLTCVKWYGLLVIEPCSKYGQISLSSTAVCAIIIISHD